VEPHGERDLPIAPTLGRADDASPLRSPDGERLRDEIQVSPFESDQLALTKARVARRGEQREPRVVRLRGVEEPIDRAA